MDDDYIQEYQDFYCSKCGDMDRVEQIVLAPEIVEIECGNCETKWQVKIEYMEATP